MGEAATTVIEKVLGETLFSEFEDLVGETEGVSAILAKKLLEFMESLVGIELLGENEELNNRIIHLEKDYASSLSLLNDYKLEIESLRRAIIVQAVLVGKSITFEAGT